jgi:hypothetical protein
MSKEGRMNMRGLIKGDAARLEAKATCGSGEDFAGSMALFRKQLQAERKRMNGLEKVEDYNGALDAQVTTSCTSHKQKVQCSEGA